MDQALGAGIMIIKNPLDGDVADSSLSLLNKAKLSSSTGTKVVYWILGLMSRVNYASCISKCC
jgi:hypothetical protein